MAADGDLRSVGERIEALVGELGALVDPVARGKAEELLQLVMRFYGAGLQRMLEIVDEEPDEEAERLFARFTDDPLVASLLLLHGLHPVDAGTRIRDALERLRAHGADATLLELREGVARIRVTRSADARGPSSSTLRRAIEQAVEGAAPEVSRVDIEGLEPDAPEPLVQLTVAARVRAARALESAPSA